jgi:hypothetical protein
MKNRLKYSSTCNLNYRCHYEKYKSLKINLYIIDYYHYEKITLTRHFH